MSSQAPKRLLVLTPRFPYPVVGGDRLRIFQVCKTLSANYRLTLLSFCETEEELAFAVPDDGVFDRVERVLLTRRASYLSTLSVLPTRIPLQVGYYRSARFRAAVERLLPEHDAVLSHLIRCAEYVRHCDKPKILEMTDAISLNYHRVRQLKNAGGLRGFIYRLESGRLLDYERRIVDDFDLSILVSDTDKDFLTQGNRRDDILVASNGVDLSNLPFRDRSNSAPVIVFIGNMTSAQNMDAALYFASKVMPVLSRSLPVTFRVVGRIGEADTARLLSFSNVEVTGAVDDVAIAVSDARLGVSPMRLAAGVQNKVLEYMSLGLPVVTSTVGLEGFDARPEQDVLVADAPEDYIRQIGEIWKDAGRRSILAHNARAYVEAHHHWAARMRPLMERAAEIIGPTP